MVGQETVVIKPSRSDEVLDPDHQLRITNHVRAQFDSMVPKRPSKPNRSDPDLNSPSPNQSLSTTCIPELHKLQSLRSQPVLSGANYTVVEDDFVETQYYKELDSINKQHHTTGSGFIKVENDQNEDVGLQRGIENGGGYTSNKEMKYKSNPATNDWIPCADDHDQAVGYTSSKPNRSETC